MEYGKQKKKSSERVRSTHNTQYTIHNRKRTRARKRKRKWRRGGWRVGTFHIHIHISHFLFISYFILLIAYCLLLPSPYPPSPLSDPAGKKTKVTVYRCSLYSVSLIFFFFLSFFLVGVCRVSFVACRLSLSAYFVFLDSYLYLIGLAGSIGLSRNL